MAAETYTGRIVKALSGFYYVRRRPDGELYACRAKGIFKKRGHSPYVGDVVDFVITHEGDKEGNVEKIHKRQSILHRPTVANVDMAVVIFAFKNPDPNYTLLDQMLTVTGHSGLDVVLCFNKSDYLEAEDEINLADKYAAIGYRTLTTCAKTGEGVEELRELLRGHRATVAGPSGAGKSSLINALAGESAMETGAVSERIGRGKQTTRHVELIRIAEHTYIVDTPGFSSLMLGDIEKEELWEYFPEMTKYAGGCKYSSCSHIYEPTADCPIKAAYETGEILPSRYASYVRFYEELKNKKVY